jgi:hypothetical protein
VAATNGTVTVTAASDCAWSATANESWLHTTSSGAGDGVVSYSADANPGSGYRTGSITIGEQTFTVHQAGVNSTPPTALCRAVTVAADALCQASVPASAVDNGSFDNDGTIVSRSLSPPGPYPVGVTSVTLTVTDNDGATDSCGATITVEDQTPPVIACPANIVTQVAENVTSAVVYFPQPTTSDNCGPAGVVCVPVSGSVFALGTNTVIGTVTDAAGNTNSCAFSVVVRQTPPIPRDLGVMKMTVPKKITDKGVPITKKAKVTIQNHGTESEFIPDATVLSALVKLNVISLGACANPTATILSPTKFPIMLAPKKKLTVVFSVTFDCVNDAQASTKTEPHWDYRYVATVDGAALGWSVDANAQDNHCPHDAPPGGVDPINNKIKDQGCGGKKPDKTFGADVFTDVVVKE